MENTEGEKIEDNSVDMLMFVDSRRWAVVAAMTALIGCAGAILILLCIIAIVTTHRSIF